MAKRKAPTATAAASTTAKKPKSATGAKAKTTTTDTPATTSALETVQSTIKSVANAITDAVDVAGDLVLDDPAKTPVPVSQVIEDNVDVDAAKAKATKAGKRAKGKAVEAAQVVADKASDVEASAEKALEEQGVPVKQAKQKGKKAAKGAKESVEAAVETVEPTVKQAVEAAKPLKGKAAKAAKGAEKEVDGLVKEMKDPNSKKRKAAEDFMTTVGNKVGGALQNLVDGFGEASGMATELGKEVKAGKEGPATKKVKGKAQEAKKGAAKVVEDVVENVDDSTKAKAKNVQQAAKKTVDSVAEEGTKKGKRAAAAAGKQVKETAEQVVETGKKRGKKAVADAKDAVEAAAADADKSAGEAVGAAKAKGKKAAKKAAEEVIEAAEDSDEEMIDGFESSDGEGADSSDDESDAEDVAVREAGKKVDMSKVPMVAKDDKSVAARLKKAQRKKRGTLYLGRVPHGFYEDQMREYFSQFGDVTRLRLARNRKTGASKHYAYIEMSSSSVAEIVADTMNNYLLMGHLLKCQVIPPEDVHQELWVGANKKFRKVPRARVEKLRNERTRTKEEQDKANTKVLDKQSKRKDKIKSKGIDYDFEGHK